jgi:hypothetical protein
VSTVFKGLKHKFEMQNSKKGGKGGASRSRAQRYDLEDGSADDSPVSDIGQSSRPAASIARRAPVPPAAPASATLPAAASQETGD